MQKNGVTRVLIIRLSSIGDIVLTTPVIRCIRRQLPGAEVHYAVKEQYVSVLQANPYIDKLHVYSGNLQRMIRDLSEQDFDFVADLHHNFRSMIIRMRLGARGRSFPKANLRKWMLVQFKIDRMPDAHVVDRYFHAVAPLGVKNDGQGLDYFIPPGEEVDPVPLVHDPARGYIAFAIGARHATKKLPAGKIAAVCRRAPATVILLGGKEDAAAGEEIARMAGDQVVNMCGKISLNQSASLVRQANAVITHDTGLMHIAAAFRKKIISVWGNTVPGFGMYPYLPGEEGNPAIVEVMGLKCRPCSKLGYDRCPKGHFRCMNDIREEEILGAL